MTYLSVIHYLWLHFTYSTYLRMYGLRYFQLRIYEMKEYGRDTYEAHYGQQRKIFLSHPWVEVDNGWVSVFWFKKRFPIAGWPWKYDGWMMLFRSIKIQVNLAEKWWIRNWLKRQIHPAIGEPFFETGCLELNVRMHTFYLASFLNYLGLLTDYERF